MPSPIENHIRVQIINRHEKGETLRRISEELHLSYETVKKIWQHWTKYGKVEPNYERAKMRGTRRYTEVYRLAVSMKREHPRWGAQLILLEVEKQAPHLKLASVRTLQRWFREAGINRSAKVKQSREKHVKRGKAAHEVWAVDAKERMQLADETDASWLLVSDEGSGAILHTDVFPPEELDTS